MFQQKPLFLTFLLLLLLFCLSGCGTNVPASVGVKTQTSASNSIPRGTGTDPESGVDDKAVPPPEGHTESILATDGLVYVGSDNGRMYAFDAHTGTIRWQQQEQATTLFADDGDTLYAGDGQNTLYALNANDGSVRWQRAMGNDFEQVKVNNGIVYTETINGSSPATLYALKATDGTLLWHYTSAIGGSRRFAVGQDQAYVTPPIGADPENTSSASRTFTALDAASGHVLWQLPSTADEGSFGDTIAENQGVLYLSTTSGSLYAVQEASGHVLWHAHQPLADTMTPIFTGSIPVVVDGVVYTGNANEVFAYRASNGQSLWSYRPTATNGTPTPFTLQPLVGNGAVYVSTSLTMGNLIALRASDGSVLWQKSNANTDLQSLTLVNGVLLNPIGQVTAWSTSDGHQIWTHTTDNGVGPARPGSSAVTDTTTGILYVGGGNGVLQAWRVSDGTLLWSYALPELPVVPKPVYSAGITFTSTTTYDQAIELISDLGLKTMDICQPGWTPEDNKALFASNHLFYVSANPASAPLWLERLKGMPEVSQAQAAGVINCPAIIIKPHLIKSLPPEQAGSYLTVHFTNTTSYLAAWESLNALGFRLAAPCYEQARARGLKPTWQGAGEEKSFAQTHALVVATTIFNAVTWQQQLQQTSGVQQSSPLTSPTCN